MMPVWPVQRFVEVQLTLVPNLDLLSAGDKSNLDVPGQKEVVRRFARQITVCQ